MATKTMPDNLGVLGQHRWRMDNDPGYRDATLTAPAPVRGKFLPGTSPTSLSTTGSDKLTAQEEKADTAGTVQRARPIDSSDAVETG